MITSIADPPAPLSLDRLRDLHTKLLHINTGQYDAEQLVAFLQNEGIDLGQALTELLDRRG